MPFELLEVSNVFTSISVRDITELGIFLQLYFIATEQRRKNLESIKSGSQRLVAMAIDDSELSDVLDGKKIKNEKKTRRYYQSWLSEICFAHQTIGWSLSPTVRAYWKGYRTDAAYYVSHPHLVEIWKDLKGKEYYSPRFEKFIDKLIRETNQAKQRASAPKSKYAFKTWIA